MVPKILSFVCILVLFSVAGACGENSDKTAAAIDASKTWLAAVDRSDYAYSWREAATIFKRAVQADQWTRSMEAVRAPLGKVMSRKVLSADYRTSLPGAPDGIYVVIRYATVFENKRSAVETVTPMMDNDGKWRVSGYYIK